MQHMDTCRNLEMERLSVEAETAKVARTALQMQTLPHRVYGPTLKHDGLEWVATYGYPDPLLVGRGICPSAALLDFDNKWLGIGTDE